MRCSRVLLPLLVAAMAVAAADARAGVVIRIDKGAQEMSVSVNGVRRYTWPVSTGRASYATPSGSFTPFRLEKDHFSKEWDDAPMPHSIFFTQKGHAIHGTYETRRLGAPVSHGCVRLAPGHAARLFALVQETGLGNTRVVVEGRQPVVAGRRPARRAAPRPAPRHEAEEAEPPVVIYRGYGPPGYGPPVYGRPAYGPPGYGPPSYSYGDGPIGRY